LSDRNDIQAEAPPKSEGTIPAEELAYRLRQQRLAADFGYYALKTDSLAELLQEATRVTAEGLNTRFAKVLEHRSHGQGFLMVTGVGWREGLVGNAIVEDDIESPSGYAFKTGKPVISNHLENEERFRTPEMLVEHGIKRAVNVLIQTDEGRYGILEVDSMNEGKFEEADVAFLEGFANLLGIAIQRGRREQQVKLSEARLQAALDHQAVLTQEISHRVKNSLAAVGGLLSMQARTSTNDDVKQALADAGSRVNTIAAVHDRLWRQSDVRTINLREFVTDLCDQFAAAVANHEITCKAPDIAIATDQAITLGLLANEVITNAFKYAYGGGPGPVSLEITECEDGKLRLAIADQGTGMPSGIDVTSSKSLGVKLIRSLSQQLGGIPDWLPMNPGTSFEVRFHPAMA
jgi:two-component sensor histidine kinase